MSEQVSLENESWLKDRIHKELGEQESFQEYGSFIDEIDDDQYPLFITFEKFLIEEQERELMFTSWDILDHSSDYWQNLMELFQWFADFQDILVATSKMQLYTLVTCDNIWSGLLDKVVDKIWEMYERTGYRIELTDYVKKYHSLMKFEAVERRLQLLYTRRVSQ